MEANATGGTIRQIAGRKVNTADMVNEAITIAQTKPLGLIGASEALQRMGHRSPTPELVQRYAEQKTILAVLGDLTSSNTAGQLGKWDMSNADAIHAAFNLYLDRRIGGQHARWTQKTRRY